MRDALVCPVPMSVIARPRLLSRHCPRRRDRPDRPHRPSRQHGTLLDYRTLVYGLGRPPTPEPCRAPPNPPSPWNRQWRCATDSPPAQAASRSSRRTDRRRDRGLSVIRAARAATAVVILRMTRRNVGCKSQWCDENHKHGRGRRRPDKPCGGVRVGTRSGEPEQSLADMESEGSPLASRLSSRILAVTTRGPRRSASRRPWSGQVMRASCLIWGCGHGRAEPYAAPADRGRYGNPEAASGIQRHDGAGSRAGCGLRGS
jgi:hypothetical protein